MREVGVVGESLEDPGRERRARLGYEPDGEDRERRHARERGAPQLRDGDARAAGEPSLANERQILRPERYGDEPEERHEPARRERHRGRHRDHERVADVDLPRRGDRRRDRDQDLCREEVAEEGGVEIAPAKETGRQPLDDLPPPRAFAAEHHER